MLAPITAQVSRLQYWKSEHDEQTCEDALGADPSTGLFAVADGVGTTLFSHIWARLLVEHFLATPLLGTDPFEVEWWLRQAQELYQQSLPTVDDLPWNAAQKVQSQGSYSTLATLCVTHVAASSARATLLAFGDSCVFIRKGATEQLMAFPVAQSADFDLAPICLPSKLSLFNRYFQRCTSQQVELQPGDTLIMATDAVARWIVSAANGRYAQQVEAFAEVAAQTAASWPAFILACRQQHEMIDDDCTALVLKLGAEGTEGVPLGATSGHRSTIRQARKQAFEQAMQAQNSELMAIIFGDGADLTQEGLSFSEVRLERARAVADALREMLQALRNEVNNPDAALRLRPTWQKYAHLLADEPCAVNVRQTLMRLGVSLKVAFR